MSAQNLLRDLTACGVILTAEGDRLDVDAPDNVLTDELLTTIRASKAGLLELLTAQSETDPENIEMHDSALFADELETCPICHSLLREQEGKTFVHRWCIQPGHLDSWRAKFGLKLSQTDAPGWGKGDE